MIAVIDSGGANLKSLFAALQRLGAQARLAREPEDIGDATHVVLPGVGAAGDAMSRLTARGFDQAIAGLQVPVLGICLGMQLLFERSDEDAVACLGIVAGRAAKLASGDNLSVPHMGWSRVSWRVRDALSQALDDDQYFYFVHSYALPESAATLATARHGRHFSAVIRQRNFIGCQFHPERSGRPGQRFLGNFLALGEKAA